MVINLLIVYCNCYANEDEFWRQQPYPFSYSITRARRHVADTFMAVKMYCSSSVLTGLYRGKNKYFVLGKHGIK